MGRDAVLRFDGIYSKPHESGVFFVLRFYENGVVCSGYVTRDPKEADIGFNRKTANHGCGSYTQHEEQVSFSFVTPEGSIDYECKVGDERLTCDILSTITRKNMKWDYIFTKFLN